LVREYADPVRTVLAYRLLYHYRSTNLTEEGLDEYAKNVMILVIKGVDVEKNWPPDAGMDRQVESILRTHLDNFTTP
jgi:hypothetical protein